MKRLKQDTPRWLRAMTLTLPILIALVGCQSTASTPVPTPVENPERQALVAIYQAMDGENWSRNDGWLTSQRICEWEGITCIQGKIIELVLTENKMQGDLPPEIGQLSNLQTLNLSNNYVTGLPPEIGKLTNLQLLYLVNNHIMAIPPKIGQLTNLQRLDLSSNKITELPTEIGQMTSLEELYLQANLDLKELPLEIGQLTNLRVLDLYSTGITMLPPEICDSINIQGSSFCED